MSSIKRFINRWLLYTYISTLRVRDFDTNCIGAVIHLIANMLLIIADIVLMIRIFHPFKFPTDIPEYARFIASFIGGGMMIALTVYLSGNKRAQMMLVKAFNEKDSLTTRDFLAAYAITYLPVALLIVLECNQPMVH